VKPPPDLQALYFDGRSARAEPVQLRIDGDHLLALPAGEGEPAPPRRWPLAQVTWPERTRHGRRVVLLQRGGSLQALDNAGFDAWRLASVGSESWVVRAQQHWRTTAAAVLLLVVVLAGTVRWGVPLAAGTLLVLVPPAVDRQVGETALAQIAPRWLQPSQLLPERQAALRQALDGALADTWPDAAGRPLVNLQFHAAAEALGPNAFALPGGTIVVTDALVHLLKGQDDALLGVMAHEAGHVHHRHGMRSVLQFSLLSAAASVALGDFSSLLAGLPALVAQMGYSRDAEREADAVAAQVLRASGRSPASMVIFFERLGRDRPGAGPLPIALASHPADDERVRFFQEAARGR